jgi:hypothetical protein
MNVRWGDGQFERLCSVLTGEVADAIVGLVVTEWLATLWGAWRRSRASGRRG